jgi:antigen flippase
MSSAQKTMPALPKPPYEAVSLLQRALPLVTTVGVSLGIVLLQLAQGVLLARLLGPEGRGEYAAATLYSQMLLYVGLFGGIEVICRYAADESVDRASLRRSAFRLAMITGVLSTLVVLACVAFGLPAEKRYLWPLALICALSVTGQQMTLLLSAVDRGGGDFNRYNRIRLIAAAAFPGALCLWVAIFEATLLSACWLLVFASVISVLPCLFATDPSVHGAQPAPDATRLLHEGRPYAVSMLVTDMLERLDLLLMLWLTPIVTQGYYSAMIPVAYPLTIIPNTLGLFLFNAGARQGGRLSVKRVHHILGWSLGIQALLTLAFVLLVGPVVAFVYGKEFSPAVIFAMWLAPVAAIKGIVQGLESYVKGRGRPLATIRIRVISAVAMLIVIAAFYRATGVLSIIQGSLVGQVVCLLGLAAIVYKDAIGAESKEADAKNGES